jgi:signal transduction histidine kinase
MDTTLIYFIYGLAFFSMGLTLWFEARRSPLVAEAAVLLPLALFGYIHGVHEWLEMFQGNSVWLGRLDALQSTWLRLGLLAASFISLMVFGLLLLRPFDLLRDRVASGERLLWWSYRLRWPALLGYVALVFWLGLVAHASHQDRMVHLDATLRYFLAVPGAVLAGGALWRQSHLSRQRGLESMARSMRMAGGCFLIYAATQAIVPAVNYFPGNLINTAAFAATFGFPVQVVRAIMAVLITFSLARTVQAAETERQAQFRRIEQDRLAALERVQAELLAREDMRQQLMRSIVLAQEDERSRIARELHDETAQTLTAFSLHLAALRSEADGAFRSKLEVLQGLCKQMSLDLYRLVRDLRPAQLDDLGLAPALSYLASEDEKRLGLKIDLQITGPRRRLASLVETVLFRIAQEALTNVARHAGVKQVQVRLEFSAEQVCLYIEDHGKGFDVLQAAQRKHGSGLGLVGMRERADSVGGRLAITSVLQQGTRVEVTIPLDSAFDQTEKLVYEER